MKTSTEKWISVSERLPEQSGFYEVYNVWSGKIEKRWLDFCVSRTSNMFLKGTIDKHNRLIKITHWRCDVVNIPYVNPIDHPIPKYLLAFAQ